MNSQEAERIGTTEALFRDVNERIAEGAARFDSDATEFVCECADAACTERVEARLSDYDGIRASATKFLLQPGHEDVRVERVVGRGRAYAIVEKIEESVVRTVCALDPRAGTA